MTRTIEGINVPDSKLAREVTELVRDTESPLLFHHSSRVYYFGALAGKHRGLKLDQELLAYVLGTVIRFPVFRVRRRISFSPRSRTKLRHSRFCGREYALNFCDRNPKPPQFHRTFGTLWKCFGGSWVRIPPARPICSCRTARAFSTGTLNLTGSFPD
jgi:hypothetical protein